MIYTIKVEFDADRELTAEEIEALLGSIELQIEEPQNYEGEDETYATIVHKATIEREAK